MDIIYTLDKLCGFFFGYIIHEIHPLVDITTLLGKKLPELCDFLHGKSPYSVWCPDNYQLILVIQTITGISVSWYPLWISYDCCLTNMYYLVVFTLTVLTGIYFYIRTKVFSVVAGTGIYAWKSTFETLAFPWLWTVFVCTIHMGDIPNFDWCWVFHRTSLLLVDRPHWWPSPWLIGLGISGAGSWLRH